MGQFLTTLKTGTRAAIVATLIGATTMMAAAPAQAQSFSFNFGVDGGGSNFTYGFKGGKKFKRSCLDNREIRQGLRDADFYDIRFLDSNSQRVRVVATWDRNDRDYTMRVNRCTGKVTDIKPLKRKYRPGFKIELQF